MSLIRNSKIKVFAAAGGSGSLDEGNYQQGVFYRVVNGKLQKVDST